MKRVFLFLLTNLAVMLVLSVVVNVFGLNRWLDANGLNLGQLLAFSLVMGFGGAFISLLMSKVIAKWSTGTQIINPQQPRNREEAWLVQTVSQLAERAGIGMPEVGIYEGPPNAFATGASRNSALVAVSTGLLESMTEEEVTAVLGHEIAHVANGDMVTLTLIQGVVNTFVVFFARIVGYLVDKTFFRREGDNGGMGMGAIITTIVCEMLFGILASMIVAWFSRQREYRADAGSAQYLGGRQPMIRALQRLGGLDSGDLPKAINALGINGGGSSIAALFSTHPPIESRIQALQSNGGI